MKEKKSMAALKCIGGLISVVLLYSLADSTGMKKYAAAMLVCVSFLILGMKKKFDLMEVLSVMTPSIIYVLLGGGCLLFGASPQISAIKVMMYCVLPMILSMAVYICYGENIKYMVDAQFIYGTLFYLLSNLEEIFWPIIRAYRSNWITLIREFRWESSFAFTFGIFAVYYAYKKRWGMFLIAGIFAYIGNKRIVLLAMAAALAVMAFVWLFRSNKKLVYALWGGICAAVFAYLAFIYSGGMSFWSEVFNLNSNGRLKIYDRILAEYEFSAGYLGKGIGVIENLLEHWNIPTFANLHNDLLKFYIELGFWGLFIYLLSYYILFYVAEKVAKESVLIYLLGILCYTLVLFATDNVSIYLIYLIPFYTTIYAVLSAGKKNAENRRYVDAEETN